MKKNRKSRSYIQNSPRRRKSTLSMESLEDRHLLAANVLASIDEAITSTSATDEVVTTVTSADEVTLVFEMTAINGSAINPAAPVIRDASGQVVTPTSSRNDAFGNAGRTVVTVDAGEYTVEASAQSGTGAYRLEVSALGDVGAADSRVSNVEALQATAALIQAQGGGNHVTNLFFQQNGIDMTVDQYDTGLDADLDGSVEPFEVGLVESNQAAGTVTIDLLADVDGPVISNLALVSDTGTSATDGISTNVDISGEIADENAVDQVLVSLDGAVGVDVLPSLGDISSGTFTLTRAILDSVTSSGTLADGSHTISVTAIDDVGNVTTDAAVLNFTLVANNVAPTVTGATTATATEDLPFSFLLDNVFSDANPGDELTFSSTDLPAWLGINGDFLQGMPTNADVGTANVTITATDSQGLSTSTAFVITVTNVNDAPVVDFSDIDIEEDILFTLDLSNLDQDVGDTVIVSADQADGIDAAGDPINLRAFPSWLSFDTTTQILSGTPTQADVGSTVGVYVLAIDALNLTDDDFFEITVVDVNDSPELNSAIPDDSIDEGQAYSLDLNDFISDPDANDSLSFTAELSNGTSLPSWLSLNQSSGVFSGTPDDPDVGVTLEIVATATDTFGASVSDTYMLTVNNVNDAPTILASTFQLDPTSAAGTVVGTVDASDEDVGDTLMFSASGADAANFVVNPSTGEITVAAGATLVDGTVQSFTVTVTDAQGATDSNTITVNVSSNFEPVAVDDNGGTTTDVDPLTIAGSTLVANDTDADGDTLTVSGVSATSANGATVTLTGGNVVYDPSDATALLAIREGDSMTDTFTYTVSDGNGGTDTATVTVTVTGTESVEFILRTFDVTGMEISTIEPGTEFELRAFVQDVRADAQGVFAPFLDVTYPAALATATGTIVNSTTYSTVPSGDASVPGILDEVGGLDGFDPLGDGEFEVFRIRMTAGSTPGVIGFESDPADDTIQHAVLAFLDDDPIPNEQIVFGTTDLTIAGLIPPLSGSEPGTNFANPMDTNDDGAVSPQDIIVVINSMTSLNRNMYPDVNADGFVAAVDALAIINYLNTDNSPQAPLSATESAVESTFGIVDDLQVSELGQGASLAATPIVDVAESRNVDDSQLATYEVESSDEVRVNESTEHENIVDAIFSEFA